MLTLSLKSFGAPESRWRRFAGAAIANSFRIPN